MSRSSLVGTLVSGAAAVALTLAASTARAEPSIPTPPPDTTAGEESAHTQPARATHRDHAEHDERRFGIGVSGLALAAMRKGHAVEAEGGGVLSFEVAVIPDWLEIELGVHYIRGPEKVSEMPIDVIFKKPFHVKPWLEPYIGLGPTIVPIVTAEDTSVHVGLATVAGTHFWLAHNFGLAAEVNYNLVADHGVSHQLGAVSGVVAAW